MILGGKVLFALIGIGDLAAADRLLNGQMSFRRTLASGGHGISRHARRKKRLLCR
jgi:hypothetical protein